MAETADRRPSVRHCPWLHGHDQLQEQLVLCLERCPLDYVIQYSAKFKFCQSFQKTRNLSKNLIVERKTAICMQMTVILDSFICSMESTIEYRFFTHAAHVSQMFCEASQFFSVDATRLIWTNSDAAHAGNAA